MRCYIYGSNLNDDRTAKHNGVVAFAVPEIGLIFKGGYEGTQTDCEYMSLLSFLRFVEGNPKAFAGMRLNILTDAATMVYQVQDKAPVSTIAAKYLPNVREYQNKISFVIDWTPLKENSAFEGIYDLPPLKPGPPINTQFSQSSRLAGAPVDLTRGRHFGV